MKREGDRERRKRWEEIDIWGKRRESRNKGVAAERKKGKMQTGSEHQKTEKLNMSCLTLLPI